MNRRIIAALAALAVFLGTLYYLLEPGTLPAFAGAITAVHPAVLLLGIALNASMQWLRAWRFSILSNRTSSPPDALFVRVSFQLNALNFVLPFKFGEAGYPLLMKRHGVSSLLEAAGVLVRARLMDVLILGMILLALVAYQLATDVTVRLALIAGAAALAVSAMLLPALVSMGQGLISASCLRWWQAQRKPAAPAASPRWSLHAWALTLTLAIWSVYGVMAAAMAYAVSSIAPATVFLGAAASNLAFALPVNGVGGLGAAQAAWTYIVERAGASFTDAAVTALVVYAVSLTSALACGACAFLLPAHPPLST